MLKTNRKKLKNRSLIIQSWMNLPHLLILINPTNRKFQSNNKRKNKTSWNLCTIIIHRKRLRSQLLIKVKTIPSLSWTNLPHLSQILIPNIVTTILNTQRNWSQILKVFDLWLIQKTLGFKVPYHKFKPKQTLNIQLLMKSRTIIQMFESLKPKATSLFRTKSWGK